MVKRNKNRIIFFSKYLLIVAFSILITLTLIETYIRYNPQIVPSWYKAFYPPNALEVFHPGILESTPLSGVPIPYTYGPKIVSGKNRVPSGLVNRGIADPALLEKYKEIKFRVDNYGFINPHDYKNPDVIFIGDSFTHHTGVIKPEGLLLKLEKESGLSIMSVSVPAIGPQREEWLLNNVALPLQPKAVIWFFFSGNDIYDALSLKSKDQNYSGIFNVKNIPKIISLDILFKSFSQVKKTKKTHNNILPPFILRNGDHNNEQYLWFIPKYLQRLLHNRDYFQKHKGWQFSKQILLRVSENLKHKDTNFLIVYIPSKPEVYLPYIEKDMELFIDAFLHPKKRDDRKGRFVIKEKYWNMAIENRNESENLFLEFCKNYDLSCISLKPGLEALAEEGKMGFYSADSHWNEVGQETAVQPILRWLHKNLKK